MSVKSFQIIMIGDAEVGRAEVLLRFTEGASYTQGQGLSMGEDSKVKALNVNGNTVKLTIMDPAGSERFRSVTSSFYKHASGVVLVYDVTDESSFENCTHWQEEVKKYGKHSVVECLLGNKIEKVKSGESKRAVATDRAEKWAKDHGIQLFYEVSTVDGTNIDTAFTQLTIKLLENQSAGSNTNKQPEPSINVNIDYSNNSQPAKKPGGRCNVLN
eukprot:TRINITY_DN18104_c0_g1_i1.p1 TRINITY_DN18104_c0_g1~~TRINITY_DN18104_c0_g1_i1.p1  ORF type:complete len:215 (-),score=31.16 TRINITY_DN18104_c0_g1_i1:128-772(-)